MTDKQTSTPVRYEHIGEDQQGQRLDNFLFTLLKSVPKSRIYRMLRSGEVRVNKKRAKQTYRLVAGDAIRIPPVRVSERKAGDERPSRNLEALLNKAILFETDDLLVINKPSGLAVHGGSGINLGLIEAMRFVRPDCKRLELVHRLDRDTSGCLMIAKNRRTLVDLHQQLQNKTMKKSYLALVNGRWPGSTVRVDAPLQKNELSSGERVVRVHKDGRRASTLFKVQRRFKDSTLLEAQPVTGRTHQIRVHTLHTGHAIAGDQKYATQEMNRASSKSGLKRLFLHACQLQISLNDKPMTVKAELEPSLQAYLDSLES